MKIQHVTYAQLRVAQKLLNILGDSMMQESLRKGCNTTSGLSVKLGLGDSCVRRYLRELGHDGYVRIAGFCPRTGGRRWAAIN